LLIIGTAMIIAILSILLLIFDKLFTNSSISSHNGIEMMFQVIRIARNHIMDILTYPYNTSIIGLFLYAK
jgi:hypothetical protein